MFTKRKRKPSDDLPVKRGAKRIPQPSHAHLLNVITDVRQDEIDRYLNLDEDYKTLTALSQSCTQMYSIYQPKLNKHHLRQFLQAVVDDKLEKVKRMLDAKPTILLEEPDEKLVVESQYTWQKFYAENALTMAAKRRQLEMIEVLLPYFDKLPDKALAMQAKTDALSKWPSFESKEEQNKISIPREYTIYLQFLVDVIRRETFHHGTGIRGPLSEETEEALHQFREIVLPRCPVRLDDYFDPELFLYAAFKSYDDNFDRLDNWDKRSAYCRCIIGFSQCLLTPKDAEKWCEGLYYVVEKERPISSRARSLLLFGGEPFYRESRVSAAGTGFQNYYGMEGWLGISWMERTSARFLEKLYQTKTAALQDLCIAQTVVRGLNLA